MAEESPEADHIMKRRIHFLWISRILEFLTMCWISGYHFNAQKFPYLYHRSDRNPEEVLFVLYDINIVKVSTIYSCTLTSSWSIVCSLRTLKFGFVLIISLERNPASCFIVSNFSDGNINVVDFSITFLIPGQYIHDSVLKRIFSPCLRNLPSSITLWKREFTFSG